MNWGGVLAILLQGVPHTVVITLGAFAIGVILGLPVALLRLSNRVALNILATIYIEVLRGVPQLAWIFVAFYGIADIVGPLNAVATAIAALGLVATAYMAEIYRAAIQSVSSGQPEAGRAIGLHERDVLRFVLLPQAAVLAIPASSTFVIGLLKDSALASVIGATDITYRALLLTDRTLHGLDVFLVAAGLYIVMSIPLAGVARWSGQRLTATLRRRVA